MAAISLIDDRRQWFKSRVGTLMTEAPRDSAFCAHGILQADLLVVEDARTDPRFSANPLVAGEPGIRFYAGAPLVTPGGHILGMLCVIDLVPRELTPEQTTALQALSRRVMAQLESRRTIAQLQETERALRERTRLAALEAHVRLALLRGESMPPTLHSCCEAIVEHLDGAFARIWTLDECEQILDLQASAGLYTCLDDTYQRIPVGKFRVGGIAEKRQPHLTNRIAEDPCLGNREWARREGLVGFAGYPLLSKGRLIGVVAMFAYHPLAESTLSALASIADHLALGIERKRTEELVQRQQTKLQILFDLMPAMICFKDIGNKILRVNRRFAEAFGKTVEDCEGKSICEILQSGADESHEEDLEVIRSGILTMGIRKTRDRNGRELWLQMDKVPFCDGDGKVIGIVVIAQDVTEQRRAEDELRESKRFAESIAESTTSFIYLFDLKTRENVYANRNFRESLGYSQTQLFHMGDQLLPTIIHPEDLPRMEEHLARLAVMPDDGAADFEYRIKHAGGSYRWIWARETVFNRRPDGTAWQVMGTALDITERKRAEAAFQELTRQTERRERMLNTALSATSDFAYIHDRSGRFLYANQPMLNLWGVTLEEAVGKNFSDLGYPEDLARRLMERIEGVFATGRRVTDETAYTSPFGHEGYYEYIFSPVFAVDGSVDFVVGSTRETTGRRKAEAELRFNEQRYRWLVEATSAIVWDTPASGDFEEEQPRWSAFTGQTFEELRGAGWLEAIHPDDRAETLRVWTAAVSSRSIYEVEHRLQFRDQTYREMMVRAVPIEAEDGTVIQWIGVHTDITERKRAQARLLELNRQLIDLSREAGMAEIATSVLHNVGNVLNSANVSLEFATTKVRGLSIANVGRIADLLEDHIHDLPEFLTQDVQGQQLVGYLLQLAQHLERGREVVLGEFKALRTHIDHINEIVARQQSYATSRGIVELLPINELIEDALGMNAPAFDGISFEVVRELDESIPPQPLDRHKIMQILVNLFRNACQALAEADQPKRLLMVRTKLEGGSRLKIKVADNGVGIPGENLTRIFAHGFTTRRSGHGFGLHSCALAAQEMGGTLEAASAGPGLGAIFTLEIPTGNQTA